MTLDTERIERLIAGLRTDIDAIEGMVDTERRVVSAQYVKVEDPVSPQIIRVSEGGNLALGNEGNWRVIGTINKPVSHTGDLLEVDLGVIPLPPNSMGPNGVMRVWSVWEGSPSGSGHRFFIYFGQKDVGHRIAHFVHATHQLVRCAPTEVWNQGATDHQGVFSAVHNFNMIQHSVVTASPIEMAEDTTAEVPIYFTGKVDNPAHTTTLHYARVEALYRN